MASSRRSPIPPLGLASIVWLACTVTLLLGTGVLLWKLVFGEDYRLQALKDAQRIEFDLTYEDGHAAPQNLMGETLSLETARAMSEAAATVPPSEPSAAAPAPVVTETPEEPAEAPTDVPDAPAAPDTAAAPSPAPSPAASAPPAPDTGTTGPELEPVERMTDNGIIPAIAADGTKPWQYFAKRDYAKAPGKPRIAVIVTGLGLARLATESAIALPPEVTLSFSPYGRENAARLAEDARAAGHELLLDLPMQTETYPAVDPGPYGIRTDLSAAQNHDRLMNVLAQVRGYVGLLAPSRDVVSTDRNLTAPLVNGIAGQGLLFVSGHSRQPEGMSRLVRQAGVPILFTDVELDARVAETYIRNQLARAEDVAHSNGKAVVVGHAYPITLELLEDWTRGLAAKGFALVPVSALGEAGT